MSEFPYGYGEELEAILAGKMKLHDARTLASNAMAHLHEIKAEYVSAGFNSVSAEEMATARFGSAKELAKECLLSNSEPRHPLRLTLIKVAALIFIPILFLVTYNFLNGTINLLPAADSLSLAGIAAAIYIIATYLQKRIQWWVPAIGISVLMVVALFNFLTNTQRIIIKDGGVYGGSWVYDKDASAFLEGANSQLQAVETDLDLVQPLAGPLSDFPELVGHGWIAERNPDSAPETSNGPPSEAAFLAYIDQGVTPSSIREPIPLGPKLPFLKARSQWIKELPWFVAALNLHSYWGLSPKDNPHRMTFREYMIYRLPAYLMFAFMFLLIEIIPSLLGRGVHIWRVQRQIAK